MTREEIVDLVRAAVALGFCKFRLTGGEPLMRDDVVEIVRDMAAVSGVEDLSMTTNGQRLAELAEPLAKAGLHRVNVSLDSVDPDRYREITRVGDVGRVIEGIRAALAAGLRPVKLNCVIEKNSTEPDARGVADFAAGEGLEVRFIRRMDLEKGRFWVVEGGGGGDCPRCNRLRVTSDGHVKPCLFSDLSFNIRELGTEQALRKAIKRKPESGHACRTHDFCAVGG